MADRVRAIVFGIKEGERGFFLLEREKKNVQNLKGKGNPKRSWEPWRDRGDCVIGGIPYQCMSSF